MRKLQSFKRGWLVAIFFLLSQQGNAQINPSDYEHTMSVTAVLHIDGAPATNLADKIYIKNGVDLVGEANFNVAIPSLGNYAFLTVYSNASTIDYKVYYYNAVAESETELDEDLSFSSNNILGSISDPYVFSIWNTTNQVMGCTDVTAFNYNSSANTDDGSCISIIAGCMDSEAFNYDAIANTDNSSCIAVIEGCLNEAASNYNATANTDDASCISWEAAHTTLEITNTLLSNEVSTLTSELETQNDSVSNLQLAVGNLEDTNEVLSAINSQQSVVISSLETENAGLDSEVASLTATYTSQLASISTLTSELGTQTDSVISLNSTNTQLELDLATALNNAEDGIGQDDVDTAYADGVSSVIPEDGISQADVDAVQLTVSSLQSTLSSLELTNEVQNSTISSQFTTIDVLETENDMLNTSLISVNSSNIQLQIDLTASLSNASDLSTQVSTLTDDNGSLTNSLNDLNSELETHSLKLTT